VISAALFRRQKNHPRELEHRGNKLNNDPAEEWPKRAEQSDIKQLQQDRPRPKSGEQIKNEVGGYAL
jgi:hypothetical protein